MNIKKIIIIGIAILNISALNAMSLQNFKINFVDKYNQGISAKDIINAYNQIKLDINKQAARVILNSQNLSLEKLMQAIKTKAAQSIKMTPKFTTQIKFTGKNKTYCPGKIKTSLSPVNITKNTASKIKLNIPKAKQQIKPTIKIAPKIVSIKKIDKPFIHGKSKINTFPKTSPKIKPNTKDTITKSTKPKYKPRHAIKPQKPLKAYPKNNPNTDTKKTNTLHLDPKSANKSSKLIFKPKTFSASGPTLISDENPKITAESPQTQAPQTSSTSQPKSAIIIPKIENKDQPKQDLTDIKQESSAIPVLKPQTTTLIFEPKILKIKPKSVKTFSHSKDSDDKPETKQKIDTGSMTDAVKLEAESKTASYSTPPNLNSASSKIIHKRSIPKLDTTNNTSKERSIAPSLLPSISSSNPVKDYPDIARKAYQSRLSGAGVMPTPPDSPREQDEEFEQITLVLNGNNLIITQDFKRYILTASSLQEKDPTVIEFIAELTEDIIKQMANQLNQQLINDADREIAIRRLLGAYANAKVLANNAAITNIIFLMKPIFGSFKNKTNPLCHVIKILLNLTIATENISQSSLVLTRESTKNKPHLAIQDFEESKIYEPITIEFNDNLLILRQGDRGFVLGASYPKDKDPSITEFIGQLNSRTMNQLAIDLNNQLPTENQRQIALSRLLGSYAMAKKFENIQAIKNIRILLKPIFESSQIKIGPKYEVIKKIINL